MVAGEGCSETGCEANGGSPRCRCRQNQSSGRTHPNSRPSLLVRRQLWETAEMDSRVVGKGRGAKRGRQEAKQLLRLQRKHLHARSCLSALCRCMHTPPISTEDSGTRHGVRLIGTTRRIDLPTQHGRTVQIQLGQTPLEMIATQREPRRHDTTSACCWCSAAFCTCSRPCSVCICIRCRRRRRRHETPDIHIHRCSWWSPHCSNGRQGGA
jgi:hypothetical protein